MGDLLLVDRKTKVLKELKVELGEIEKRVDTLESSLTKQDEDVCTLYLRGKVLEITKLHKDIETFKNPKLHFTKAYRTLEGHCSKLQTDLDRIDVFGREDLRSLRKSAYQQVDNALKLLSRKAHGDGKVCTKCEVQS